ncbi:alginate export family protein [Thermosulfurimonas sp. F29]|uniref:alginate export family protein n=1 Tax=Thermosulfurimonas sp. F29 TaxID=2867247 RepID=UPI001C8305C9|nr:alginate export family protein [Thermosulfurimonas sp. F29]MBX6422167.1 alginate export family protein [Thermosulfurimonas sp. F29]
MKRWVWLAFFGILMWVSGALAYTVEGKVKGRLDFKEEIRYEYWNTFDKKYAQDNFDYDDSYSFVSSKMRFGAGFSSPVVDAYAQLHWTQFFGLPDDGEFGLGALYYKFNGPFGGPTAHPDKATNIGYGAISQAWVRVKPPMVPGLSVKLGRFFYLSGLEGGLPKNATLKWVKKVRISQRMIGPFDWSRVGRAFDGGVLSYDFNPWNFTLSYMHPTPGGFYLRRDDPEMNGESTHDIDIVTAVLSLKDTNPYVPNLDAQLFYYYYNDERRLSKVKTVTVGTKTYDYTAELTGLGDCEVHMLGGHLVYARDMGSGVADFLLWGGYQWGTWGRGVAGHDRTLDHKAWAIAVEAGYKFKDLPWQPWFRVGYFYGTGDDDPNDGDHETFFMMIPTLRVYSMTPSYTFMNTNYWMAQVILKPRKNVVVRSDVHFVNLTEDRDIWYLGSGMMRPDALSYAPVMNHIAKKDDDLLTMWDLSVFIKNLYQYNGVKVGLDLYLSHIWGGDVVEDAFQADDDLTFFYAELRFTF